MDQEIEEQREKLLEDRRDFVDDSLEDVDINSYTTRKTVAEGVLDMTILTRNATLLRELLHHDGSERMFYHFLIVVISMTLILQVSFTIANVASNSKIELIFRWRMEFCS